MKEDVDTIVKYLARTYDITPYTHEELLDVTMAGVRVGEIAQEKRGIKTYLTNVDTWFTDRVKPNTIILTQQHYKKALYRAFRLIVMANIAKTDFGSSRQRDFGQMWTDFARGFLGELGIEEFFKHRLGLEADLEEVTVGDVKTFLPSDITRIKEGGTWRQVRTKVSIKTSKLKSLWLDIGSQINHSDAFIFIKIGLTTDHLISFMKSNGFIESLIKTGHELHEVADVEEEKRILFAKIPDVKPIPAYISGFAWKSDMENGTLIVHSTAKKNSVVGGIGYYNADEHDEVEGLGDIGSKHIAATGALRWSSADWNDLKNRI